MSFFELRFVSVLCWGWVLAQWSVMVLQVLWVSIGGWSFNGGKQDRFFFFFFPSGFGRKMTNGG